MKPKKLLNPIYLLLLLILHVGTGNILAAASPPATQVKNMTLSEAVALALRHNKTVESAYLDRILEKFTLKIAQEEFRPEINLSASAIYAHTNQADALAKQIGADISLRIPTGGNFTFAWRNDDTDQHDRYHSSVNLSFTQPLLKGAGLDVNLANQVLAERQEQGNLLNLKSTLTELINRVIHDYRSFFLAQREMEITRLSLDRARKLLDFNGALLKAGRIAQVELIQAEADLANQELSFRTKENALDTMRLNLLKTLDIDRHLEIEPTASVEVQPVVFNVAELQKIAVDHQPKYLQTLLAHDNAKTSLMLADNNKLWELELATHYNLTGASDSWLDAQQKAGQLGKGDYSIGLSLRIPLGELTRDQKEQGVLSAKITLRQAELNLQQAKEDLEIEIQDAVRNINLNWEQIKLAKRARELAQKQLDIELEKFKVNRSTNFEVVKFKNDLISSQNSEISTQIEYLNALTDLDALLGITLDKWGVAIENVRTVELP
jgi:outer membrane protein TolC